MKHWKYLKYVLKHKWYVFRAGEIVRAPFWRLLIHDWTKFLPCEWFAYANYFYGNHPSWYDVTCVCGDSFKGTKEFWKTQFDKAWNHHQKHNKHHWQYWLLTNDSSSPKHQSLPMPEKYIREMVADWVGAGLAITGTMEVRTWYLNNKDSILLEDKTRERVEELIAQVENYYRVGRQLGMALP